MFAIAKWLPPALALALVLAACGGPGAGADDTLLVASFDATGELVDEVNAAFAAKWRRDTGRSLYLRTSHGGSGKQARSVIDGLPADVLLLALPYDLDAVAKKGRVDAGWRDAFPERAAPFTSTVVFMVRRGNPRGIDDWDDLGRDGVRVVTANPKTSGAARLGYLAAWAWALAQPGGDEASARALVTRIYANVPTLDSGARGATTTFAQRGIGDVLITWEAEAYMALAIFPGELEVVTPTASLLAEPPVAVVAPQARKHGTEALARAYLEFLYSDEGQAIVARHHFRPRRPPPGAPPLPPLTLFTVDDVFGGWAAAHKLHFAEGGSFDQIYLGGRGR